MRRALLERRQTLKAASDAQVGVAQEFLRHEKDGLLSNPQRMHGFVNDAMRTGTTEWVLRSVSKKNPRCDQIKDAITECRRRGDTS